MMKRLEMKYVYDYMLYVLQGYGKLMRLNVTVPENATEVCSETMACPITDGGLIRQCMDDSLVMSPSVKPACNLPQPYEDGELKRFLEKQENAEREVEKWTDEYWEVQSKILQQWNSNCESLKFIRCLLTIQILVNLAKLVCIPMKICVF